MWERYLWLKLCSAWFLVMLWGGVQLASTSDGGGGNGLWKKRGSAMGLVQTPRYLRHHGSTGKTLLPTLPVDTPTNIGLIVAVRRKKKYPRRYLISIGGGMAAWFRRDEFTPGVQ